MLRTHAAFVQERTYVVGPHGGKMDSIKVDSFTGDAHVPSILPFPCQGSSCSAVRRVRRVV